MDITNFEALLTRLDSKEKGLLLSTAYDPKAKREDLQHVINTVLSNPSYSSLRSNINIDDVLATAPKGEIYEIEHEENQESHENHTDFSLSGQAGTLVNHDKYQSDILDQLGQQQQNDTLAEFDKIRESDLSYEQKQQALRDQFQKILEENATHEQVIASQQELLAKQLEDARIGTTIEVTDEQGNKKLTTDAAETVRKRSLELKEERKQDRNARREEFGKIESEGADLEKQLQTNPKMRLTKDQRNKLSRYQYLRGLKQRDEKGLRMDVWQRRFAMCKTKEEQDALIRKFLRLQQHRNRIDTWRVFDKKYDNKPTLLHKKTLSRAQRRQLSTYQKVQIRKSNTTYDEVRIRNSIFDLLSSYFQRLVGGSDQNGQSDSGEGGNSGDFSIPNPFDAVNRIRNFSNPFKNFGGQAATPGAEALGGVGGATGAAPAAGAGAAGAGGGTIIIVVIVIIVILLLIVLFVILASQKDHNSYTVIPLNCNTPQEIPTDADVQKAETRIQHDFFIDVSGDIDKQDPVLHVQKVFYDTTCLLFGNVQGATYTPQVFNTFGQLVVGTLDQRTTQTNQLLQFQYTVVLTPPPDPSIPKCSIQKFSDAGKYYSWTIYYDPASCDDNYLAFIIAHSLAQDLLLQQQHLNPGRKDIFALYHNLTEERVPTYFCQASQKEEDCFDDTIASYLTWGRLFSSPPATSTSTSSTNTTDTTATSSAILNLPLALGTLGIFPSTFPDTYTYAYTNLFDHVAFFADSNFSPARLDEFVADVKQCQGPDGNDYTPDRACAVLLRDNAPDRAWWLALDRVGPNYQCGAFVWSYEDLYSWPDSRGNGSGGVSGWYWLAQGKQDGYEWIRNPYRLPNSPYYLTTPTTPSPDLTAPDGGHLIQPGDIIIYATDKVDSGDVGHVAIVKSVVDKEQFNVIVEESNYHFAHGLAIVTDDRHVRLNEKIRDNYIQGWWRSNTLKASGSATLSTQ